MQDVLINVESRAKNKIKRFVTQLKYNAQQEALKEIESLKSKVIDYRFSTQNTKRTYQDSLMMSDGLFNSKIGGVASTTFQV